MVTDIHTINRQVSQTFICFGGSLIGATRHEKSGLRCRDLPWDPRLSCVFVPRADSHIPLVNLS